VENLNRLNSRYKEDQRILDLKSALSQGDVKIEHSIGAQQGFIIRALYDLGIVNHVFVALDKEEATRSSDRCTLMSWIAIMYCNEQRPSIE